VEKTPARETKTDDDGGGEEEEEAGKRSDTRVQDATSQDPLLERTNTSQRQTAAGKRSKEYSDSGGVLASASGEPQHDSQRIGEGDDTGETEINPMLTLVTKRRNAHRKKVKPAKDRPHSADEASSSGTVCVALSLSLRVCETIAHNHAIACSLSTSCRWRRWRGRINSMHTTTRNERQGTGED
jgi:hypothetical protein